MADEFGMKLYLELVLENLNEKKKEIEAKLGSVNIKSITDKARTMQGAIQKGGDIKSAAESAAGIGKIAGTIAIVAGILFVIGAAAKKILQKLEESSPYLRGILSVFNRAFMLFFKPFGDFLAVLLRPLAMILMRLAVGWLKASRTPIGQGIVKGVSNIATGGITGAIDSFQDTMKLLDNLKPTVQGTMDKLSDFGGWLWDKITGIWNWNKDAAEWLWGKIKKIWNWEKDMAAWLWGKITSIWTWSQDFGTWVWEKITTIWDWKFEFGDWVKDKVTSIWEWSFSFGGWLEDKLTSIWSWNFNFGAWLWDRVKSIASNYLKDLIPDKKDKPKGSEDGNARGLNFVPETGMYKLHRGETVTNAARSERQGLGTLIFSPKISVFTQGGSSASEMESAGRRMNRMFELQLRSNGLV